MSTPAPSRRPRSKKSTKKAKPAPSGKGIEPAQGVRRYYSPTLGPDASDDELESLSGVSSLGEEWKEEIQAKGKGKGKGKAVEEEAEEEGEGENGMDVDVDVDEPQTSQPGNGKIRGSKGHAGGHGKKGKKFVEDKSALLNLITSIPSLSRPTKPTRRPLPPVQPKAGQKPVKPEWETVPLEGDDPVVAGEGAEGVGGEGGKGEGGKKKKPKKEKKVLSKADLRAKEKLAALALAKSEIVGRQKEAKKARREKENPKPVKASEGRKRVGFAV